MKARIDMSFTLPFELTREGRWFIAYCPALDLASQGQTEAKAKANLEDAIRGFLESCFERGVLEKVLKQSGFHPTKRAAVSNTDRVLEVPMHLLSKRNAEAVRC